MAPVIATFATETEGGDWWYDHRDLVEGEFLQAFKEGRVKRGTSQQRAQEAEAKQRAESFVALDEVDLKKARAGCRMPGHALSGIPDHAGTPGTGMRRNVSLNPPLLSTF